MMGILIISKHSYYKVIINHTLFSGEHRVRADGAAAVQLVQEDLPQPQQVQARTLRKLLIHQGHHLEEKKTIKEKHAKYAKS